MKHYTYILLIAIALIGCEKNAQEAENTKYEKVAYDLGEIEITFDSISTDTIVLPKATARNKATNGNCSVPILTTHIIANSLFSTNIKFSFSILLDRDGKGEYYNPQIGTCSIYAIVNNDTMQIHTTNSISDKIEIKNVGLKLNVYSDTDLQFFVDFTDATWFYGGDLVGNKSKTKPYEGVILIDCSGTIISQQN